jgi:hypothetical protein
LNESGFSKTVEEAIKTGVAVSGMHIEVQRVKPFIPRIKLEKLHQQPQAHYKAEVIDEIEELQYSGYTTTISKKMMSGSEHPSLKSLKKLIVPDVAAK